MQKMVRTTEFNSGRYRGIFSEVARQEQVSVQAIRQAYFYFKDPRIIALVDEIKRIRDKQKAEEHTKAHVHSPSPASPSDKQKKQRNIQNDKNSKLRTDYTETSTRV